MALTDKLTSIADAIREKGGTTELLTLDAMPTAIAALPTGGGEGGEDLVPNPLIYTGYIGGIFRNDVNKWILDNYYSRLKFEKITNLDHTFYDSSVKKLPKISQGESPAIYTYAFASSDIEEIECIEDFYPSACDRMFNGCLYLRNCPPFTGTIKSSTNAYQNHSYMFCNCYSLRNVDENLLASFKVSYTSSNTNNIYYNMFNKCMALDEINRLGVLNTQTITMNLFVSTFISCYRLKKITFNLQDDGTPIVAKWKYQTIDLSKYTGWAGEANADKNLINYNSGITAEDEDNGRDTNPNYWTRQFGNSRFGHAAAVEFINSLPDTSAYLATQTSGTNTVKFYSNAGSNVGDSVNALTEEEIAVAAAKGWTISYTG